VRGGEDRRGRGRGRDAGGRGGLEGAPTNRVEETTVHRGEEAGGGGVTLKLSFARSEECFREESRCRKVRTGRGVVVEKYHRWEEPGGWGLEMVTG